MPIIISNASKTRATIADGCLIDFSLDTMSEQLLSVSLPAAWSYYAVTSFYFLAVPKLLLERRCKALWARSVAGSAGTAATTLDFLAAL